MVTNEKDKASKENPPSYPNPWAMTPDENKKYFQEYRKLIHTAFSLTSEAREINLQKNKLKDRIEILYGNFQELKNSKDKELSDSLLLLEKPKRTRRTNDQLEKNFICPVDKCEKRYSSDGSLQQHIKLKHRDQYEKIRIEQKNSKNQLS